jgi:hypothetical protein
MRANNGHGWRLRRSAVRPVALLASAMLALASGASATENGRNPFPNGLNGTEVGSLPPPGLYVINEIVVFRTDRFNDSSGDRLFPNFDLDVTAYAPRFLWNTGQKLLGGDASIQLVVPFVDTKFRNPPPAPSIPATPPFGRQHDFGVADPIVTPLIAWHGPKLHTVLGADINIPIGQYDRSRLVSAGLNTFIVSPALAATYYPSPSWELSAKATVDLYFRNPATDYHSGNAFMVDFALNHHRPVPGGKFILGVGGYIFKQFEDDRLNGVRFADGFRGQAFGVGPTLTYQHASGPRVELKHQWDFEVENRPAGARTFVRLYMKLH